MLGLSGKAETTLYIAVVGVGEKEGV